jgi:predicted PurR-regulated permease PerM
MTKPKNGNFSQQQAEAEKQKKATKAEKVYRPFLLVVLFFSLYLTYLVFKPFTHTIVFSIVLASLFYPVRLRVVRLYRGRDSLAALTVVAIIVFAIIIPLLFLGSALVVQGTDTVEKVTHWINAGNLQKLMADTRVLHAMAWFRDHLAFVEFNQLDLQGHLLGLSKRVGQFLLSRGAGLLRDVAGLVSHFFVLIFISFYIIRDGHRILFAVKRLSPLREEQENRIVDKVADVIRVTIIGNLLTAICQGVVGAIGLAIVGLPALFWGTVMAFSSLIPVVGTALVWVPAAGYLVMAARWKSAVFLIIWGIVVVGSVDNFLRPFLMRGKEGVSPFYIFLTIIGGIQLFGLAGILYGPLILGFATVMLYIYQVEYQDVLGDEASS